MGDRFYQSIRTLAAPFAFRCLGAEHIAGLSPAIFIGNHLGSVGPIQAILSVPVRTYPWMRAEMMDHARGPKYLYDDFIAPSWHLKGRVGMIVSRIVSRIAIGIFHGVDAIPAQDEDCLHVDAFRRSLSLLLDGRSILIFSEDPQTPIDPATGMRTFLGGFVQLSRLYEHKTGVPLRVHPIAISATRKAVLIGPAIFVTCGSGAHEDIKKICAQVQAQVYALLQQLETGQ